MNLLVSFILAANLLSTGPTTFTATTIDGRNVRGALAEWDGQSLVLREDDREERLKLDQLLSLIPVEGSSASSDADAAWITLTDGSSIAAESYSAESQQATATTKHLGVMSFSTASVDYVRFQKPSTKRMDRWNEILHKETDRDLLVVASADSLDYLEGIVRAVRDQEIEFDLDGEVLPVRRSKVFGIRYYHAAGPATAQPLARLTDESGSTWAVHQVSLSSANSQLAIKTPLGIQLTVPLDVISRIEFAGSGLVFLSDLAPDTYEWTPYFGSVTSLPSLAKLYRPRTNTTFDSQPIVLDGIQYSHGLALHSRTEITYRLSEPFQRFQATVGIDDHLRPRGNVHLKILGDDRVLFDATIAGTEPAEAIDISLEGVATLTIKVDFGADLDEGDHLILAEAKLLK